MFDLLARHGGAIDPRDAKIHLAKHNRTDDPLDVFFAGNFKAWQESQSKRNFPRDYIISLIKLPQPDRWMFAGVYSTHGHSKHEGGWFIYKTRREPTGADLIGRVIVRYKRGGKQSYLLGENFARELVVDEVRREALTAEECSALKSAAARPSLDDRAAAVLEALVRHVRACQGGSIETLTYEDLATLIGRRTKDGRRAWPRGMGKALLAPVGRVLAKLGDEWGREIPHIGGMVVQKSGPGRGLPDAGIDEFWDGYSKLSRPGKKDKLRNELHRIEQFGSRWNDVLRQLGLNAVIAPDSASMAGPRLFGRGGESPQHKALKEYVHDHPEVVGAKKNCVGIVEYPLPSGDEIDVLFRSEHECVAVEVKSSVSNRVADDFKRGIYQTIKYLAVLRAMVMDREYGICANLRSVLVLQGTLPAELRSLTKLLSVEVIENVEPSEQYLRKATAQAP